MIKVRNLSYRIGTKTILKDIHLTIQPGTFTVIIGPNGSGKTTLMRHLVGDLLCPKDSVLYRHESIVSKRADQFAQERSVLEQQVMPSFPYTGEEILHVGAFSLAPEHLEQAIVEFSLRDLLTQRVTSMSGGEFQRLHAARVYLQALASPLDFHCIFLDEPTSALDLGFQFKIMQAFRSLCRQRSVSICAIFHDLNLTKAFADHVVMLKDGCVFAQGPVQDVLSLDQIAELYEIPLSQSMHNEFTNQIISKLA